VGLGVHRVESEASFCLEGIEKAENHEIARQTARQNATFKLAAPSSPPTATVSPARSDKSDRLLGERILPLHESGFQLFSGGVSVVTLVGRGDVDGVPASCNPY
jgi:hypothetical protein